MVNPLQTSGLAGRQAERLGTLPTTGGRLILRCRPYRKTQAQVQLESLCESRCWPPALNRVPELGFALDACLLHDVP
jgi:hypothetical protein